MTAVFSLSAPRRSLALGWQTSQRRKASEGTFFPPLCQRVEPACGSHLLCQPKNAATPTWCDVVGVRPAVLALQIAVSSHPSTFRVHHGWCLTAKCQLEDVAGEAHDPSQDLKTLGFFLERKGDRDSSVRMLQSSAGNCRLETCSECCSPPGEIRMGLLWDAAPDVDPAAGAPASPPSLGFADPSECCRRCSQTFIRGSQPRMTHGGDGFGLKTW